MTDGLSDDAKKLAKDVAHRLANHITPILNTADMALLDADPEARIYADLLLIREAALQAKDLVIELHRMAENWD
jgi:hypothetical protein